MRIRNIYYSSGFAKAFKKLPKNIQLLAVKREKLFRENCFYKSLKTHKLKGELSQFWSFSVNHGYRILFEFLENKVEVGFIDIGTHSIYKR